MKATHGRTQRDPPRCKSIEQEKGRRNEASSNTLAMLMPFPFEEPLRPRTNPSSTQKRLSEGTRPRPEHSPHEGDGSGKLLDPRPAEPEWDSNAGAEPERSPSGARAEPERSREPRKEHGTPKGRSEAGAEPERSPSGARTEHRTPKGARDFERTPGVPKLHYSETAGSPVIPGRLNAPQAHQTPISLPIYMGTGTVALCKTDPVSWAQTLMPHHPVEAHFHTGPITISSESAGGFAMAAVAEEDGRSKTVQELSSDNDEDIEILAAEEITAQRAAGAAAARVRVLKARAGSSKSSASAASKSSRWPSSYTDVSERSLAPPDPLLVPLQTPQPIPVGPAAPAILPIVDVDAAAGGVLPQQVPAHLQNLYERAHENVRNMEMAREFWRARDRDLQERRE